jgi:prepilin-type N-terminal cleavage/methylation domain-containing protein
LITRTPCRLRTAGFTLVEVAVALTVVAVASTGLVSAIGAGARLHSATESYGAAERASRQIHEQFRAGDLVAEFASFSLEPQVQIGDVTVEVRFPASAVEAALGQPAPKQWRFTDLDGDGQLDFNAASTATGSILPVEVTALWSGGELATTTIVQR